MQHTNLHRRTSSGSTVKGTLNAQPGLNSGTQHSAPPAQPVRATLWVHDDNFSTEDVLINEAILEGSNIKEGSLVEIYPAKEASDIRDFQSPNSENEDTRRTPGDVEHTFDRGTRYLCIAKFAPAEFKAKQANLQVSIKSNLAQAFGLRSRSHVWILASSFEECTASHVEFSFRDVYLARSDMWRLVGQELAGRTVFAGQKITFMGSTKLTVKSIHVHGHKVPTAYFAGTTIPIFRSEAARYVLFIQMSSEMWDFDSEGHGEIMFNRVINGFLPDLFKRWHDLDVRHLVSIVLFGRLEYDRFDLARNKDRRLENSTASGGPNMTARQYQDFYRVVVTDMASAQWTTILDELKKDFRVFLRDISLHTSSSQGVDAGTASSATTRIAGRPSTALKGNILEAINIASNQFADDYIDRDLIRTGISVVVVTAGTGVFEVDRDLLNLTSQTLTNNGVGIDIVCLSKMPLHSVPLFKYRVTGKEDISFNVHAAELAESPRRSGSGPSFFDSSQPRKLSPALSSTATNSTRLLASYVSGHNGENASGWYFGIPQWIDLSYWSADAATTLTELAQESQQQQHPTKIVKRRKGPFVPRVRMYEIQMMGLMELGMADMSIPYISETQNLVLSRSNRIHSKRRRTSGIGSLSRSPTMSRKGRLSAEPARPNQGLLSTHAKALGDVFDRMDVYDAGLFQNQAVPPLKVRSLRHVSTPPSSSTRVTPQLPSKIITSGEEARAESKLTKILTNKSLNSPFRPQLPSLASVDGSTKSISQKKVPEPPKVNRNLSYSLRGLAPPIRAVASTEVNTTNIQAQPLLSNPGHARPTVATSAASIRSVSTSGIVGDTDASHQIVGEQQGAVRSSGTPSKPISINTPLRKHLGEMVGSHRSKTTSHRYPDDLAVTGDTRADEAAESGSSVSSASDNGNDGDSTDQTGSWMGTSLASSVPKSNVPFIQNVNASNPLKRDPNRGSLFGKWQHLYPRKPRTATVKWRSLCTPASVPLTTEDFPSKHELDTEYEVASYDVKLGSTNQMLEIPESRDTLLQEMMALRFSHGYQLIVGQSLVEAVGPRTYDTSSFFTPDIVRPDGSFIFMSMGSTIQKISLEEADRVRVTKFVRKIPQVQPPFPQQLKYYPNIKTILSDTYNIRDLEFNSFTEQYPWEAADKYLADFTKQTDADIQALRFWRARFVLIPVEPPATARRPAPSDSEENEEEIHLRGIRALTQMWQKARYVPPDERRPVHNRLSTMKAKDRNPLRINLETLNPSELVATELDKLIAAEEAGELQTTQLLPEEEQFDRDSFNLAKLAQAIQSDKGIEIKNRRWHWRLHYSCFSGEDLTNWLVHNFRDIDTREEAVDFGNELMTEGLFEHVNSRHKFKDGNFFYSIKPEWRIQRPEARQSWFPASRRSDRSVPPTPISEHPARELVSGRSRSGSNLAFQAQIGSELGKSLGDRKRRTVTLSKMIRIDVDHRKRSNRPEIINLHYDRLHNPENCYHLELSWFNVTSKLVDDAIVNWTTQAEKYGLKLVELPILEASKIPEHEPFRAPYRIKLSLEPPRRNSPANVYYTATSFGPQAALNSDNHLYQKALLKRFNFVLDLEAVSEFPENVEIQYSWGKLDYRYTQFVHRSGIVLAQITDEGDLLLLANRLYNSRQALTNQAVSRFENIKKDATANLNSTSGSTLLRPPIPASTHSAPPAPSMQASGIIGLNVQSPQTGPFASPLIRPVSVATSITTSLSLSNNNTNNSSTSNSNIDSNSPAANNCAGAGGGAGGDNHHYHHHHQVPVQQQPQVIADVFATGAGGIGGGGGGGGGGGATSSTNRRGGLVRSGIAQYVTPEQIKDELEAFCQDRDRLDAFFREVTATLPAQQAALKERERERGKAGNSGGTSSSLLRPIREPESERGIPEFNLPEAIGVTLKKGAVGNGTN
ncbi:Vacuolar membrane-associated protein iml1 [Exophiala dermatitidis]